MQQALSPSPARAPALSGRGGGGFGDALFAGLSKAAGMFVLVLLGAIIVTLAIGAWPAIREYGVEFLFTATWNPNREIDGVAAPIFGGAVPIYGTIITSILALLMAVPIAFGIAFFLTELAPGWMRRPVGTAVELLAAVPSIIYGMWGFFVIVPIMGQVIETHVQDTLTDLPYVGGFFDIFFGGSTAGTGILTASIILGIMIIPFVAATMRDVFLTVPAVFKESAYGIGCTRWEVMRSIVLPYTRSSVVGGIMLGLGRALGETMAVTFVIGNANRISPSLFSAGATISSKVALEFPGSFQGTLNQSSLLLLGLILFVISFIVLAISRRLLRPRAKV